MKARHTIKTINLTNPDLPGFVIGKCDSWKIHGSWLEIIEDRDDTATHYLMPSAEGIGYEITTEYAEDDEHDEHAVEKDWAGFLSGDERGEPGA